MKIIVLLFASFFGFGLAVHETVRVDNPAKVVPHPAEVTSPAVELPVMHVLLDTVEITAVAPTAVALN